MKSCLPLPLSVFPSWSPSHLSHKHLEYRSNHFTSIRAEFTRTFRSELDHLHGGSTRTDSTLSSLRYASRVRLPSAAKWRSALCSLPSAPSTTLVRVSLTDCPLRSICTRRRCTTWSLKSDRKDYPCRSRLISDRDKICSVKLHDVDPVLTFISSRHRISADFCEIVHVWNDFDSVPHVSILTWFPFVFFSSECVPSSVYLPTFCLRFPFSSLSRSVCFTISFSSNFWSLSRIFKTCQDCFFWPVDLILRNLVNVWFLFVVLPWVLVESCDIFTKSTLIKYSIKWASS